MSYLNLVMLIGNLGEDPEMLKSGNSGCFVRLSLATNKKYINAWKESVKDTQWHTVYLNNGVGQYAASYLKKGDKVLVSGELRTNEWKDKEGQTRYSTAVYARECRSLASKPQEREEVPKAEIDHVIHDAKDSVQDEPGLAQNELH